MIEYSSILRRAVALVLGFSFLTLGTSAWALADRHATEPSSQESDAEPTPLGLSGEALAEVENDVEPETKRLVIPPYYRETSGNEKRTLVLPLFYHRERTGAEAKYDVGLLPLFWRHKSEALKLTMITPLYWHTSSSNGVTDVVVQTYFNRSADGFNFGFAPLVFFGVNRKAESNYQVLAPLLWRFKSKESSFLLALIYYQKFKKSGDYALGLPPLFFSGRSDPNSYTVVFPLYWRFGNALKQETKTVVPPFFYNTREHGRSWGLMPLLYFARDKEWSRSLVFPFYYSSRLPLRDRDGEKLGEVKSYYLPLLLSYYRHGAGLSQGGSLIFYHWYEKDSSYLKMFSPFVWMYGDRRTGEDSLMIPPLFYRHTSPVADNTMAGLLYWNYHQHHKSRFLSVLPFFAVKKSLHEDRYRAWALPTFDFGRDPDGGHFRFHPVLYTGKKKDTSHFVLAPLVWRFADPDDKSFVLFPFWWGFDDIKNNDSTDVLFPLWWRFNNGRTQRISSVAFPLYWDFKNNQDKTRTTLVAPLFWRHRTPTRTMTGLLNFVWHKGQVKNNRFWAFSIFPLVKIGKPPAPSGAMWSVLGGLAGWRRQGRTKELKLLWIPFDLTD